jgi:hypothetical protein
VATGYVDLGGSPLIALALPDQYAGGNITIQAAKDKAAADAGTFYDVYDSDGIAVTVTINGTITGGRVVSLISSALQAVSSLQFIRIKSAQAVGANRVIGIIAKG